MSQIIKSPCVRNCCLDKKDICIGCGRTLEEIMQWQASSISEKKDILRRAALRKKPLRF
ncbi:MAG: DUF1289 domain-containing protein [endosymbiont of Galathealinum brachiosum]|uniref:DUF1289 domain-containing protein n=1 Tax=endosymbiont of Galathealinum brachiosum TaxID=2200906 RepID=A0A370DGG3_9GAMM|nr:MAG: DUF1289 domain-containing protein [endosymbiont of Galathealinum brachiosum]